MFLWMTALRDLIYAYKKTKEQECWVVWQGSEIYFLNICNKEQFNVLKY